MELHECIALLLIIRRITVFRSPAPRAATFYASRTLIRVPRISVDGAANSLRSASKKGSLLDKGGFLHWKQPLFFAGNGEEL